jgi:hypothetical protein
MYILIATLGLIFSGGTASAKTYNCEMINSKDLNQYIYFDSRTPSMTRITTYLNSDGTVKLKESQTLIDANFICEKKVNVKADCKLTEIIQNGYTLWKEIVVEYRE